jgi:hypothetical protein
MRQHIFFLGEKKNAKVAASKEEIHEPLASNPRGDDQTAARL